MNDVQLVRAASRITGTQMLLSISSCLAILGFVVGWNRLLKKASLLSNKSLNEISIHLRKSFEAVSEGILLNDQLGRVSIPPSISCYFWRDPGRGKGTRGSARDVFAPS